ncbi:hypothetical protein CY35_04G151400 [Sphagnum magellanicum]|nr:hypothetical protein CY35_04G151400 [Sphagnum magellanicum]
MISIVSTGICDILQNFIAIHAVPLCNLQHPLRSERLLSINVQSFSLASLPNRAVIGKLHTTSDKSPSQPRPKLNRSSVIHSDSMPPSRTCPAPLAPVVIRINSVRCSCICNALVKRMRTNLDEASVILSTLAHR